MSLMSYGNYTRFLRNNYRNTVAVFTCANGSSMSCAKVLDNIGVDGQGEQAARRVNSVVTNDNRAVVKRGLIKEDVSQKV